MLPHKYTQNSFFGAESAAQFHSNSQRLMLISVRLNLKLAGISATFTFKDTLNHDEIRIAATKRSSS